MTIPPDKTPAAIVDRIQQWDCLGCGLLNDTCRYHQALQDADHWRDKYETLLASDIGAVTADRDYWQNEAMRLSDELNGQIHG